MPYSFTNYQYSLTDQLTSVTYSSGRKISYTLDAADQVTAVNGTPSGGTPAPYASNITYSAAGDLATLPFGNGITESHTWNSRFQQTGISAGNLLGLGYTYCPNGQAQCPSGNTGTPWQHTIAIGGRTRPANPPPGFAGRILTIASRPGAAGGRQCSRWRTKSW
jgi:hypothetical protein